MILSRIPRFSLDESQRREAVRILLLEWERLQEQTQIVVNGADTLCNVTNCDPGLLKGATSDCILHRGLLTQIESRINRYSDLFDNATLEGFKEEYYNTNLGLTTMLTTLRFATMTSILNQPDPTIQGNQTGNTSTLSRGIHSAIKLPKLQLAQFHGEVRMWESWWSGFRVSVHDNVSIDDVIKYQYLLECVKGVPRMIVSNYQCTAQGYLAAIKALKGQYDDPKRQQDVVVDRLLDLQVASEDTDKLLKWKLKVQGIREDMSHLQIDLTAVEPLFRRLLLKQLPDTLHQKVLQETGLYPSSEKVLEAVDTILKKSKDIKPAVKPKSQSYHNYSTNSVTITGNNERVKSCFFCKGEHNSMGCTRVNTHQAREIAMKKAGRCTRCMRKHEGPHCGVPLTPCYICQDKHHTWLCPKRLVSKGTASKPGGGTH